MTLTDVQKKQIKEEEKYRKEAREKLSESSQKKSKKSKGCGCFTLIVIFLVVIGVICGLFPSSDENKDKDNKSSPTVSDTTKDLVGNVNFDRVQFHITNQEERNWENCRFTLNGKYRYPPERGFLGSETKVIGVIRSSETYSLGAGEFTLKDGTRFNSFTIKPQDFSISCDGGFGYWSW